MILKRFYRILQPLESHWEKATCEDIDCRRWVKGFKTILDPNDPHHHATIAWLKDHRKGEFVLRYGNLENGEFVDVINGSLICFDFPPGIPCFDQHNHRKLREREPFFVVHKQGEGQSLTHDSAVNWVEDFSDHQNKLARLQ